MAYKLLCCGYTAPTLQDRSQHLDQSDCVDEGERIVADRYADRAWGEM